MSLSFSGTASLAAALLAWPLLTGAATAEEIAAPTYAPIVHEAYFVDERHNPDIAYTPDFEPGLIGFDPENRPFIRAEMEDDRGRAFIAVQTLTEAGTWRVSDLSAVAMRQLGWNGVYSAGHAHEDRIVFDARGTAYTIIDATPRGSDLRHAILMVSPDGGAHWTAHVLRSVTPGFAARLEFRDGHNVLDGPPPILISSKHPVDTGPNRRLRLLLLSSGEDGRLATPFPDPILVSDNALLTMQHSGAGNTTVSSARNVHIVYPSYDGSLCPGGGTPNLGRSLERSSGRLSDPVLLGCGPTAHSEAVDPHNSAAATLDGEGHIHVVIGAHQMAFQYGRSPRPDSFAGWRPADLEPFGEIPREEGNAYTYVSLIGDRSGALHVVGRYAGTGYGNDTYRFQLVYLRKPPGAGSWSRFDNPGHAGRAYGTDRHKLLVYPDSNGHLIYRHKLGVDRRGRLFLFYALRGSYFDIDQERAYCRRWPAECTRDGHLPKDDPGCELGQGWRGKCWYQQSAEAHTPVLMLSEDGGQSWKLATTRDFRAGP